MCIERSPVDLTAIVMDARALAQLLTHVYMYNQNHIYIYMYKQLLTRMYSRSC